MDDCEKNPSHFGDCVKQAISCNICIFEGYYCEGLLDLSYFQSLIDYQDKEVKDKLAKFNTCILFMTICQLQENYWNEYTAHISAGFKNNIQTTFTKEFLNYIDCLNQFLGMTEEEQMVKYARMEKVYEYIQNPTKIDGIPWW